MRCSPARAGNAAGLAALAVMAGALPLLAAAAAPWPAAIATGIEKILEVRLNGQLADAGAIVQVLPTGGVLVAAEDAHRWRLRFDDSVLADDGGTVYLPLDAVAGLTTALDEPRSLLTLTADPGALTTTALAIDAEPALQPDDTGPGAFLNYDLQFQESTAETTNGAQLRLGFFDGCGLLSSEHSFASGDEDVALRLMTTLRKDFPGNLDTLRIGDFTSAPSAIGQAALIGGVQWGTNFSLQPSLVTFPFQSLAGEAALPSTVDVYLNGALRESVDAPPGPFQVSDIPVITGQGTLRMVVTDSLGRRVTVEQPFFATSRLLRPGLHEQSWELGALREDFGIASNRYGRAVAITTHRWGLSDRITAELRAEALSDQQTLGAGAAWLAGSHGVVQLNVAYGGAGRSRGPRAALGFQGQWDAFSLGAEIAATDPAFRQAGDGPSAGAPPAATAALTLGWSDDVLGSFGLALVGARSRTAEDSEVVNLSWSREVSAHGHLSLSYFQDFAVADRSGVAVTFSQSIGDRTSSSLTVSQDAGAPQRTTAEAQRSLDRGPGWGWRIRAGDQGDGSAELTLQEACGVYRIGTDRFEGDARSYLGATGGLVWFSHALMAARRIDSAFGLVRVPGMPGVRVYYENDVYGVTNRDGELLLPGILPYQANEVRIEVEDLPFDAVVASDRASRAPSYGAGVLLEFPVRIERGVTLTLVQPDGRPVPAGARLRLPGKPEAPVGEGGFAFVGLAAGHNRLVAAWSGGACAAELELPAGGEPQPDLGTIACQPIPAGNAPP